MGLFHKRVKNARTGRSYANGISTEQMELAPKGASSRDFLELRAGRTTLQNNVAEQRGRTTWLPNRPQYETAAATETRISEEYRRYSPRKLRWIMSGINR
jgi:hypothetical protein